MNRFRLWVLFFVSIWAASLIGCGDAASHDASKDGSPDAAGQDDAAVDPRPLYEQAVAVDGPVRIVAIDISAQFQSGNTACSTGH